MAGLLAMGLLVFVVPPGGAYPGSEPVPHASFTAPEKDPVRASDETTTPSRGPALVQGGPSVTASLEADLVAAREEETAARVALAALEVDLDRAKDAQLHALEDAGAAHDALMRARVRLGDLITAESAAVTELDMAVAQVERAHPGSKARRSAFTQWQMTVVAERAAHARQTVAADIGAHLFARLRAAEADLAEAELALGEERSTHLKAERTANAASTRVEELEAIAPLGGDAQSLPTTTSPRAAEGVAP